MLILSRAAGQRGIWEIVQRVFRSVRSSGNLPCLPVFDGRRGDRRAIRFCSQDGSGYLFNDVATPGRRMGQLPLPFRARGTGRSGGGCIAQPLAIKIHSSDCDDGGAQAPAGGYPVVIRGKGSGAAFERSGGKARAPVAVLRPITTLCGNVSERRRGCCPPGW